MLLKYISLHFSLIAVQGSDDLREVSFTSSYLWRREGSCRRLVLFVSPQHTPR